MANINLLPWREERRQALKKEFLMTLLGVAVFAVVLIFLADRYTNGKIDHQKARNDYLVKNITELDQQVKEIADLESKKQELLDRMRVIQELQGNRPVIVRVFDEMVRTLPDGVFYQSLTRAGSKVSVDGIAESNNRVSSLMRKLDRSQWFASPNLAFVAAKEDFGEQASEFKLSYVISSPDKIDGEE